MKRNAYGEPSGFRKSSGVYFIPGLGSFNTKPEAMKEARRLAKERGETVYVYTPKKTQLTVNPAKFDRCVKAVKKRGGAANAYAVCTAAGTRKNPLPPVWEIEDLQDGNWQFIASVRAGSAKEAVSIYRRDHASWAKGHKLRAHPRRGNPAAESIEAYRDFHGKDPKEMVSVTTQVHFHKHLAAAGELKFLIVDTPDGKYRVTIRFKKLVLLLGTPAAYSLARFSFPIGSKELNFWFFSQRVMPPVVVLAPFFILLVQLRLVDTWIGLILIYTTFNLTFGIVIMRDVFRDISRDMIDAAKVDGANAWQVFWLIGIPLSLDGLIVTGIIVFSFCWNEALFCCSACSATHRDARYVHSGLSRHPRGHFQHRGS